MVLGLTEQAHAGVPGRIRALPQPAEVGIAGQQQPGGAIEGARQVSHGGVDADHQIQLLHHVGGVGKVGQPAVPVVQTGMAAPGLQLRRIVTHLQGVQLNQIKVHQREQAGHQQRERALLLRYIAVRGFVGQKPMGGTGGGATRKFAGAGVGMSV